MSSFSGHVSPDLAQALGTHAHARTYSYTHTRVRAHTHTHTHTCVRACVRACVAADFTNLAYRSNAGPSRLAFARSRRGWERRSGRSSKMRSLFRGELGLK